MGGKDAKNGWNHYKNATTVELALNPKFAERRNVPPMLLEGMPGLSARPKWLAERRDALQKAVE